MFPLGIQYASVNQYGNVCPVSARIGPNCDYDYLDKGGYGLPVEVNARYNHNQFFLAFDASIGLLPIDVENYSDSEIQYPGFKRLSIDRWIVTVMVGHST